MRCPSWLGLIVAVQVIRLNAPNVVRVKLPCDSELDIVLANCFTPPLVQRDASGNVTTLPAGAAAAQFSLDAIAAISPSWQPRVLIPVPSYAREWFRHLHPGTMQVGYLFVSEHETLNDMLVRAGHATREQPLPTSLRYDGNPVEV
jgi:hypothetical protein